MLKSILHKLGRKSLGTALATVAAVGWSSSASAQDAGPLPPLSEDSPFGPPEAVFNASGRQCGGWSASIEALWLKRKTSNSSVLAEERFFFEDTPAFNSLQIDKDSSETEGAWRLTLTREFDDCSRLEFIYFELNDVLQGGSFTAVGGEFAYVVGPGTTGSPENWPFLIDGVAGDVIGFSYSSDLRNIELNHFEVIQSSAGSELSLGIGLRYLHLDENFSLFANEADGTLIDRLNTRTSNHLLGAQLGAAWDAQLCERVSLTASGKAGLLLNTASQNTDRTGTGNGDSFSDPANLSESDRTYGLSGVVEVGVQVRGQLCDNVNLMAGYNVFYLSGLALAPDQLNGSTGTGSPGVDSGGESLYYGPSAGLEITWGGGR